MRHLYIDIETYSTAGYDRETGKGEGIADVGAHRYAMDPSFKILLVSYAFDEEPVQCIDLAQGEHLPNELIGCLLHPTLNDVTLHAYNATFERICFSVCLQRMDLLHSGEFLSARGWECDMVKAARCGLPMGLKLTGEALNLAPDQAKMKEGAALIQLFCCPRWKGRKKTTSADLFGELPERVQPSEAPEKWATFKRYCIRDVETERTIAHLCEWYQVSDFEKDAYVLDQLSNDRGVLIDVAMAQQAERLDGLQTAKLSAEAATITGLSNPCAPKQLAPWLSDQLGIEVTALNKDTYPDIVKAAKGHPLVERVIAIRKEIGKVSNTKYTTMLQARCDDDRCRGLLQFYGTRTGRWAGRLVQLQNLPQNHIEALDTTRAMVVAGDYDSIDLMYGSVSDTLSQLIRTAFIAQKGYTFAVCDYSAIEARVLAWCAGEEWVLDVFRDGGDIYCATASRMFHVPVEKHGQNGHLRANGKVATLALGYQGGTGALDAMGAGRMGMSEEAQKDTVVKWRDANPHIVQFWTAVETAAKRCVTTRAAQVVKTKYTAFIFQMRSNGTMTITLPSGRDICYPRMTIGVQSSTGETGLSYMGIHPKTHKWCRLSTYGGKLTENICQAIGRDCLAETMQLLYRKHKLIPVMHIHDELVIEVPASHQQEYMRRIEDCFASVPEWAKGLPLKGAGYLTPYYKKD